MDDALAPAAQAAQDGRVDEALGQLRTLFEQGYQTPSRVYTDPRFSVLRNDRDARRAWRELMKAHAVETRLSMVSSGEAGQPMSIRGQVVRSPDGTPVPDALVLLYHTDATGHYEPGAASGQGGDNARLFCYVRTDDNGRFEVQTIKPAPYPGASESAAHVHFQVEADGFRRAADEFRPYTYPREARERDSAVQRLRPASNVREERGAAICDVSIPLQIHIPVRH